MAFHSGILKSNFIGQFSLAEVKWNVEIILQKFQERNTPLPINFYDSHPKSFIDLNPRSNLMVPNWRNTTERMKQ